MLRKRISQGSKKRFAEALMPSAIPIADPITIAVTKAKKTRIRVMPRLNQSSPVTASR